MRERKNARIFISWSLDQGKQLAELTKKWIKSIFINQECFVSSEDIRGGADWWKKIEQQLSFASVGIFCITNANKERPWILYEAGRIAGNNSGNGVVPFVFDLERLPADNPLSRHQARFCCQGKEQYFKVIEDINECLPDDHRVADDALLRKTFDQSWEEYGPRFEALIEELKKKQDQGNQQDKKSNESSQNKQDYSLKTTTPISVEQSSTVSGSASAASRLEQRRSTEKRKKEQRRKEFIDEINHSMVRVKVLVDKLNIESTVFAKGAEVNCLYDLAEKLEQDQKVEILVDKELVATEALKDGFFDNVQRREGDVWPVEKSVAQRLKKNGLLKILTENDSQDK